MGTFVAIFGLLSLCSTILVLLALAGAARGNCMEQAHERAYAATQARENHGRSTVEKSAPKSAPNGPDSARNPAYPYQSSTGD